MRQCMQRLSTMPDAGGTLNAHHVPDTVEGAEATTVNKTDKVSALMEFTLQKKGRKTINN